MYLYVRVSALLTRINFSRNFLFARGHVPAFYGINIVNLISYNKGFRNLFLIIALDIHRVIKLQCVAELWSILAGKYLLKYKESD